MIKTIVFIVCFSLLAYPVRAQLAPAQLERVKAAKELLKEIDTTSVEETVEKLSQSVYPEGDLMIMEAVASTYRDMVFEHQVEGQEKKEWLHSMVLLNMAYFQMGGSGEEEGDTGLNIAIRRKLKQYLSADLMADRRLFHSLEQ
ncbi:MAG TPA: hypothetical protein VI749_08290 [Candidatus Omnitrophota bacterium]|nr:hypothetical protein [Candidatus Omnitrophota bacterium]